MSKTNETSSVTYNRCKTWQMGFFALNNTATNTFMFLMNFVNYYAVGVAGLLAGVIGIVLTSMRIWDGVTDPIIGYYIDKTNGKYGKFRPFMIAGWVIMAIMCMVIFHTTHKVPQNFRLIYFILCYAIYIIGYTFQTACTKAGQNCLTNDPKQRPVFSMFDGVYNTLLFMGLQILVASVFVPKFSLDGKSFDASFFHSYTLITIAASGVMTLLAVIGIWQKDRIEFFGTGKAQKIKFSEYIDVIKHNRAIQMLVVAASTDKLAGKAMQNSILTTVLFGILIGNYELSGKLSMITLVPTILLGLFLMNLSRKTGMKKAVVTASWAGIVLSLALGLLIVLGDASKISLASVGFMTVAYIVLSIARGGVNNVSSSLVIPMISDCADYETYRSGRYVPGMMGTLFSFVDKLVSSLSDSIVMLYLAAIGYSTTLPQIGDAPTTELKVFWFIMFAGLPVAGLIANIIAMKFYPLDKEKMAEIQETIAEIKEKAAQE